MFLSAVLFVLFLAGCWLYCLTDAVLMPAAEFPGLPKPAWIAVIAVTFILGAIAWVITRKLRRIRYWPTSITHPGGAGSDAAHARQFPHQSATATDGHRAAEALARHPASRSRNVPGRTAPIGPDDDPEFLRMLDRLISGSPDSTELSAILTVTIGGRSYTVWKTTGNYIAFVPSTNFTSASMDLLAFFKWIMSKGWIPDSSTLGQVDYGVELVSTNGAPATFTFSNFAVNAR